MIGRTALILHAAPHGRSGVGANPIATPALAASIIEIARDICGTGKRCAALRVRHTWPVALTQDAIAVPQKPRKVP